MNTNASKNINISMKININMNINKKAFNNSDPSIFYRKFINILNI